MRSNIVLIDSRVTGYQTLIDSLATPSEVFIIDAESDGLAQIAARLQGRSDIDALHLISHGSQGALYLGATVLDSDNLASYAAQLASIGGALTQSGDILLYGCNVAQGDAGVQFITSLAQATGADVAASSNATGASILGGDAVLEQASGSVETTSLALNGLTGVLAVAGNGMVSTDFGVSPEIGQSVTLQADGKILLAGYSYNSNGDNWDFALARYNSNGSLDRSFSGDGMLTTDFGASSDYGRSVTLQADGKILLAGNSENDFALVRYNSNGSLDASFSGDGKLTTDFEGSYQEGRSVTLQADGKILLAGTSYNSSDGDFALVRYNSNGSLDTSFSGDGKLTTDFLMTDDVANSVTLQADGKILLAGTTSDELYDYFALARYNSDGSLDSSFGTGGKLTTIIGPADDIGQSVTLQADGKILLAGTSYSSDGLGDFALVRYNSNGTLDTSFDGDGRLTTDFGASDHEGYIEIGTSDDNGTDKGYSVTLQADGKILLAGTTHYGSYDYFALARYNSNGSLDSNFSGDGMLITAIGASDDVANSVTLQADGKILLAGYSYDDTGGNFALARYNSDGSLDTSFGAPNNSPTGSVTISGTAMHGQTLSAANTLADLDGMGTIHYQWLADGTAISGATARTLVLGAAQVGQAISVSASYTDALGTPESVTSRATADVAAAAFTWGDYTFQTAQDGVISTFDLANTYRIGAYTDRYALSGISAGTTVYLYMGDSDFDDYLQIERGGAILAANDDGGGSPDDAFLTWTYQTGDTIQATTYYADATGSYSLYVGSAVGAPITLTTAFTNRSPVLTTPTAIRYTDTSINNTFSATIGTLHATDADGNTLTYGISGGTVNTGVSSKTGSYGTLSVNTSTGAYSFSPRDASIEALKTSTHETFTVTASDGTASTTAAFTVNLTGANDTPTGSVTITGTATQGQTLSASNTLADAEGLGTISYQWLANGAIISGATARTLVLGAAQVGKAISVKASYTDGKATAESVTSAATAAVAVLQEPGVTFRNATALTTTEDGGTATFQVVLNAVPRHDVVLTLSISNGGEGKFQASGNASTTVTFTAANWNKPQTVTLVGVDDGTPLDGDMAYVIQTKVSSEDTRYDGMRSGAGLPIANITVTNIDNDAADEWYGDAGGVVTADFHTGGNGSSDLYGRDGRDELYGGNGDDRLYGSYGDDALFGDADNDELEGEQGNDKLNGGTGNDNLNGGTGKDTLLGGDGNDMLDGDKDADSMNGGNGADTYYVDNAGDVVSDSGTDTGKDTVYITAFLATGYTLGTGIDNATLQAQANNAGLTGNTGNNSLTGNASNNALDGGAGADSLNGGDGLDSLTGGVGNDSLSGGDGNDILYAGSGNDVVDAGAGNDVIVGGDGAGNDRYTGGAGSDTVKYTSATAAITVNLSTGSASGTNIGSDTLAQIENVIGGKGSDKLTGNTLANSLTGDTGNDTLDGGAGTDKMYGGLGNDTYYVRDSGDAVSEALNAGTDTVLSYLSAYTLGTNIENGRIMSAGSASLTGNTSSNTLYAGAGNNALNGGSGTDTVSYAYATKAVKVSLALTTGQNTGGSGTDTLTSIESLVGSNFNDTLTGGNGNNMLYGRAGKDVLKGGLGADKFVFDTTLGASNVDTLADFARGSDKIMLDDDIFTKLGITGTSSGAALTTAKFQLGATANDSGDRIIYNQTSGALYYDADGSGGGVAVQIALIGTTTHTTLTATDFLVVA